MVSLSERDGKLRLGCDSGPVAVHPGRATRRHGLHLEWREPVLRVRAGEPPKLTIELVNTSWRRRHNVADDSEVVVGWLLDAEGNRVRDGNWHFGVGQGGLQTSRPCRPERTAWKPCRRISICAQTRPPSSSCSGMGK
jgi:hypothetical protein